MRFFETAKLAAGIDLGKKLLGGRKRPLFNKNGRPFFLCGTGILEMRRDFVPEPCPLFQDL